MIEGVSDFSGSSLDYVAGWLSDRSGKRKKYTLTGYIFSTFAKMMLLLGTSVVALSFFRIVERLGKSFRGPPRDAWLGSVAGVENRGYAYGLHKAMDKAGAILGPIIAYFLLLWLGQGLGTFQLIFGLSVIAAILSVVVLSFMKDNPGVPHERENIFKAWRTLSKRFKLFLIPAGIFSLAYFSFSFLLLRAYDLGFTIKDVVLLYALFNVSFVIMAVPIGKLGDIIGRKYIIILGYLLYAFMCLGFIFANQPWQIVLLFLLFGIFYSVDEAQSKAFILDLEPERRATAIGVYNFVTGLIYLPASVIAGFLWIINPVYAFVFAGIITLVAIIFFIFIKPWQQNT